MKWRRAKKRRAGDAPLRGRLEVLEPRALLSGQAMFIVPVKVIPPSAVSVSYDSTYKVANVALAPVKDSAPIQITLTVGAGMWLNLRSDSQTTIAKSAVTAAHHEYALSHARHDLDANANVNVHGDSHSLPWGMYGDGQRLQMAPYGGSLDRLVPPNEVTLVPDDAVWPAPKPGATPERSPGAVFVSAANALIQAMASSFSVATRAENAAAFTVATVDARHSAVTAASRAPAAQLPAAPAVTRSQLTGNPDGGLMAIGGAAAVQRSAVDAVLEGEALTEAELEWLRPDFEEARTIAVAPEAAPPVGAPAQPENAQEIDLASFDEGMVALPIGANGAELANHAIVTVAAPVEIAAAASMFQANDLGIDAPIARRLGAAPPRDFSAAALVGASGDAAAPEETSSHFSQRLVVGAFVGLAGFEFLRRRRTYRRDGDAPSHRDHRV